MEKSLKSKPESRNKKTRLRRFMRIFLAVAVVLLLVVLATAPFWLRTLLLTDKAAERLRSEIQIYLSESLETPVHIGKVKFDLWGRAEAKHVRIGEKNKGMVRDGELRISLNWRRLTKLPLDPEKAVKKVEVRNARLVLTRDKAGKWNYPQPTPKPPRPGNVYPTLTIDIQDADLSFHDDFATPTLLVRDVRFQKISGAVHLGHSGNVTLDIESADSDLCSDMNVSMKFNGKFGWTARGRCRGMAAALPNTLLKTWNASIAGRKPDISFHGESRYKGLGNPPDYSYSITTRMNGGVFFLNDYHIALTGLKGDVRFAQNELWFDGLDGKWAGGDVRIEGGLSMKKKTELSLRVDAAGVELDRTGPWFAGRAPEPVSGAFTGWVFLNGPLPNLNLSVQGDIDRPRYGPYSADRLEAVLSYHDNLVRVPNAELTAGGATVSGSGLARLNSRGAVESYSLSADIRDFALASLPNVTDFAAPPANGQVSGRVLVAKAPGDAQPQAYGSLESDALAIAPLASGPARGGFLYQDGAVIVEDFVLDSPDAAVTGTATVQIARDAAGPAHTGDISGGLSVTSRADVLMRMAGQAGIPATGSLRILGSLRGTLVNPEFAGRIAADEVALSALRLDSLHGNFAVNRDTLTLNRLKLVEGSTEHEINGETSLAAGRLDLTLNIKGADVDALAKFLHDTAKTPEVDMPNFAGRVTTGQAGVHITGTVKKPHVSAPQLTISDLTLYDEHIQRAVFNVTYDTRLEIASATVDMGDSQMTLSGAVASDTLNISFSIQQLHLKDLSVSEQYQVSGILQVQGHVAGAANNPTVTAELSAQRLQYRDLIFGCESTSIAYLNRTVLLHETILKRTPGMMENQELQPVNMDEIYRIQGTIDLDEKSYDFDVNFENTTMNTVQAYLEKPLPEGTAGVFSGSARIMNSGDSPAGAVQVSGHNITIGKYPLDTATLDGIYSNEILTVNHFSAENEKSKFVGSGDINTADPYASMFNLDAYTVDLGMLSDVGLTPYPMSGVMDVNITAEKDADEKYLYGSMYVYDLSMAGITFDQSRGFFEFKNREVILNQVQMIKEGQRLMLRGEFPLGPGTEDRMFQLHCNSEDFDLATLNPMLEEHGFTLSGPAEFEDVAIVGRGDQPEIKGAVSLNGVTLKYRDLAQPVEQITGRFEASGRSITLKDVSGLLNGKELGLGGGFYFTETLGLRDYYLELDDIRDLPIEYTDMYQGQVDIQGLRITGDLQSSHIMAAQGRQTVITLHDGTFTLRALSADQSSASAGGHTIDIPAQELYIKAGRDFTVRTPGDTVRFTPEGSLRIAGALDSPEIKGRLSASYGSIRLTTLNMVFDLNDEAVIGLYHLPRIGLVPFFSATAEARKGGMNVELYISGPIINLDDMPEYQRLCGLTTVTGGRTSSQFSTNLAERTVPLGGSTENAVSLCPTFRLTAYDSYGALLTTDGLMRKLTHADSLEQGAEVSDIVQQELYSLSSSGFSDIIERTSPIEKFDLSLDPNKDVFIQLEKCLTQKVCVRYERLFSQEDNIDFKTYYKFQKKSYLLWGIDQDSEQTYEVEYRLNF